MLLLVTSQWKSSMQRVTAISELALPHRLGIVHRAFLLLIHLSVAPTVKDCRGVVVLRIFIYYYSCYVPVAESNSLLKHS